MTDLYFNHEQIYIYHASCLKKNLINSSTIDLIVTSPPYNLSINYNSNNDASLYIDYLEYNQSWLENAFYWLKNDGRMCLNIPLDKNKNGQQSVYADILTLAKKIGFQYHSTIIWNEGNISKRTAWGSWMSASAPYVIAPVEVIVILYKQHWKKLQKGISTISRNDFMNWTNGVWVFNGESKKRIGHPAPFPRELPKRCINLLSYDGDIILDPFMGSGTTLLECTGTRIGIGIDIDKDYCELAKTRILNEINLFT